MHLDRCPAFNWKTQFINGLDNAEIVWSSTCGDDDRYRNIYERECTEESLRINNYMKWVCVTKAFRRTAMDSRFSKCIQLYQNQPQTARFNTFGENILASVKIQNIN